MLREYLEQKEEALEVRILRQELFVREMEKRLTAARDDLSGMFGGLKEIREAREAMRGMEGERAVAPSGEDQR